MTLFICSIYIFITSIKAFTIDFILRFYAYEGGMNTSFHLTISMGSSHETAVHGNKTITNISISQPHRLCCEIRICLYIYMCMYCA